MKDLQSILKNELNISQKSPLVVSVSGGVDSMVLLAQLIQTSYSPIVVHFNHLKRDQSIIEKDLVETYCEQHEIPFYYYTIDVSEGNFHHQAHELRKHYLEEVATIHKTPYILTAHHLDDLFETVLIKLTRGSNLLGYAGMQAIHSKHGFTYVKPLLYIDKETIKDYAIKFNIPYLNDESNEENTYLRNRYRHAVVPIMKQENEQLLDQIKQYHMQVSDAFHMIREQSRAYVTSDGILDLTSYLSLPKAIQDDIIAYMIESKQLPFSFETVAKIRKVLLSKRPNQSIRLSHDFEWIKSYQKAYIKPFSKIKPFKIELKEGINKLSNVGTFTLFTKTNDNTEEFLKLCYNELAFPLWLRHREDGDVLSYAYGHKKLKKLLIDKKISFEERNRLWILTDNQQNILWVENYYLNETLGTKETLYFKLKGDKKHA